MAVCVSLFDILFFYFNQSITSITKDNLVNISRIILVLEKHCDDKICEIEVMYAQFIDL